MLKTLVDGVLKNNQEYLGLEDVIEKEILHHEKCLWNYLNECTECLYSTDVDLAYYSYETKAGVELEKPPRFVHRVLRLLCGSEKFTDLDSELRDCYQKAMGKSFNRYPDRFPVFYQSVAQINISINPAFQSRLLEPDSECVLNVRMPANQEFKAVIDEFKEQVALLKSVGFSSAQWVNDDGALILKVDSKEIYAVSQATAIQIRRRTGDQYRARLRYSYETKGQRVKLGLMVLDQQSEVQLFESTPQAMRPHGYRAKGNRISLPIDTSVEFYHKL